jgi:thiamine kinase-like enzyme
VLFADADRGIMLLPYLTGSRHLTAADLTDPDIVAKIAALLARLHGSGLVFESTMSAFPITDRYLAIGSDARLQRLRVATKPLEAALAVDHLPSAPCHIDPNTANFLRCADGRLRLIDWEFSAMCEPIWDLAGIAIEGRLDPAAEELLLIAYESQSAAYRSGGLPRARYRILKTALHLVAASWAKAELASGAARPEIAALLDEHCTALETALADPAFTRLLAEPAWQRELQYCLIR